VSRAIPVNWNPPEPEPKFVKPPEGAYWATVRGVVTHKLGQPLRSAKGALMVRVELRLDEGDYRIFDYLVMEGAALRYTLPKLVALGVPEGAELEPEALLDRRVYVDTVDEPYKDKVNLKVREYLPFPGTPPPPPPPPMFKAAEAADDGAPF
jgi:hypothetical protein